MIEGNIMDNDILYCICLNWFNISIRDKKIPKELILLCIAEYEANYLFFTEDNDYKELKEKLLKQDKILISEFRGFLNLTKQDAFTDFIYNGNLKDYNRYLFDIKFKNTLYISFNYFSDDNCYKVIKDIKENSDKKDLIIDLRGNAGGSVENAIKICNLLSEKCEIVTLQYKHKKITYYSDENIIHFNNITIFVDNNTASSSEILSLSLKENNDNVYLLGTATRNKEVGQTSYSNKKYKYYFTYSSFRWTVNGVNTGKCTGGALD